MKMLAGRGKSIKNTGPGLPLAQCFQFLRKRDKKRKKKYDGNVNGDRSRNRRPRERGGGQDGEDSNNRKQ